MKVLKIKIYQPQAHYRMPFAYRRKHTYPIPPYSTIIGLLCNVLGIRNYRNQGEPEDENYKKLKKIKISIAGKFENKTMEYIWLRNLEKEAHLKRFGSIENRFVAGHIEHIGGQAPCFIDILNNVNLKIYLSHEEEEFLQKIKDSFKNPVNKIYPLHLGRAEDWIVIEELKLVDISKQDIEGDFEHFFWIPKEFEEIQGLCYKLPTFYKLQNGSRNFDFIEVKLNDGNIGGVIGLFDKEEKLPVFLANL